jgi:hypothetical protein
MTSTSDIAISPSEAMVSNTGNSVRTFSTKQSPKNATPLSLDGLLPGT